MPQAWGIGSSRQHTSGVPPGHARVGRDEPAYATLAGVQPGADTLASICVLTGGGVVIHGCGGGVCHEPAAAIRR
jgi:hypothetical protein